MGRNLQPQCKQCRREGEKICYKHKCATIKRNYAPGVHGVKRQGRLSEYGQQLRAKQKVKRLYGLMEKQFSNYYKKSKGQTGDSSEILMRLLESRFDNVIYRLGFTTSRHLARQIIRHGHFQINGRTVNIPSYQVREGDTISLNTKSQELKIFKNLSKSVQKQKFPEWISFDFNKLEGKILSKPSVDDLKEAYNIHLIIEYYSR